MMDTVTTFTGVTPYLMYEDAGAMLEWFSGHGAGFWDGRGGRPDQLTLVWVDDVDAHYERVRAAGVEADPPEDQTYDVRSYHVTDPEGYRWGFLRRLGTGYVQTTATEEGGLE